MDQEDIGGHPEHFGAEDTGEAQTSWTEDEDEDGGVGDIRRTRDHLGGRKRTKKVPKRTSRSQQNGP